MKRCLFPLAVCLNILSAPAQSPYFQQEAHYVIEATLDDSLHQLRGTWAMRYINHSPDTLRFLYMHLWANAFSSRGSAFARQKLSENSLEFHFAPEEDRGGYRQLAFTAGGIPLNMSSWEGNADVVRLDLPAPLPPGGSVEIQTPFELQIPRSFSRLGRVEQSYQMTQWYPKPAVYDRQGWHPMPYLEWGEYYSEFGSFDVRLTLPENYVVGATGVLETPEERAFLEERIRQTDAHLKAGGSDFPAFQRGVFPPSSPRFKTIRFTAENVHDFAWFADKRFRVQRSAVEHPSGKKTESWVMFADDEEHLWKDAIGYVDRAVAFYSKYVGEYPYPHATAVQSALSAGAGMEYPMITVIGLAGSAKDLDVVITHEVGHNWFYGILGSNERAHAWMDEGINSYFERRYVDTYYPDESAGDFLPKFFQGSSLTRQEEISYLFLARANRDLPPDMPSGEMDQSNYFVQAYEKPAFLFRHLEEYLGASTFDRLMQGFYEVWKFKHPAPQDLQDYLTRESGKNLDWLFQGLLGSAGKQDYALRRVRRLPGDGFEAMLNNKGAISAPFPLALLDAEGAVVRQSWVEGFPKKHTLALPEGDFHTLSIDPEHRTLEFNRRNNRYRFHGVMRTLPPLKAGLLPMVEDARHTQVFAQPALSWNAYDKLQLGLWIHNTTLPGPRFSYSLLPFYAFGSESLAGTASARYRWLPSAGPFQTIELLAQGKRYTFNENRMLDYLLRYGRLEPALQLNFRGKPGTMLRHALTLAYTVLKQEHPVFGEGGIFERKTQRQTQIQTLAYTGENRNPLHRSQWRLVLERSELPYFGSSTSFWKGMAEYAIAPAYKAEKRVYLRLFAGAFLDNNPLRQNLSLLPNAFSLSGQGFADYRFEEGFFGRSNTSGLWSRQLYLREGGMKYASGPAQRLGRSNDYVLALNLRGDLPVDLPLPIQPYLDLGYYSNPARNPAVVLENPFLWNAGLSLNAFNQRLGIFVPVAASANIRQTYQQNDANFWEKITFTLDLSRLNLQELLEQLF